MHRGIAALVLLVGCGTAAPPVPTPTATPAPTVADARAFYASQPSYFQPVPHQEPPVGLPDLRAETCGACHRAIYDEWKVSTHARAWEDDPQFQAELHKSREGDGDVGWLCVNCHTPLENQLPRLVAGVRGDALDQPIYVDNPSFDPVLQDDAITCAVCHVRDGAVLGPFGSDAAPHPVKKAPELLAVETCTVCHQASVHLPSIGLACAFETGDEWRAGPYDDEGRTCQSCHMPEVQRPLVDGGAERATRRHWFGGSLIPKKPAFEAEVAALRAIYPEGLAVAWAEEPVLAATGGTVRVAIENAQAGHMLPTGDPERFLRIEVRLVRAEEVLAAESARIGQRWEWHPVAKKLDDNRLKPRERRVLDFALPAAPPGEYTLQLEASKWRLSEENLAYHDLVGKTVAGRRVFFDERPIVVR